MKPELLTIQANGVAIRYIRSEDGSPFLCGADVVAATGLAAKLNATNIRRRVGDDATLRIDRRDYPSTFGIRGRPDVLFFRFDALEHWGRSHPDSIADRLMRGLRITTFRPFTAAVD